jgi:hypothetical protein
LDKPKEKLFGDLKFCWLATDVAKLIQKTINGQKDLCRSRLELYEVIGLKKE